MNSRKFSLLFFIFCLACAGIRAAEKPDIVYILSDDQGSYDVGWRGSEIKTPNLDKLAASGTKLENFYVQPLCSPTRAALMTGRYPMRDGLQVGVIRPWSEYGLPLDERTLPQALREVGYTTAICGKWHLGAANESYWPSHRGFDHWYGFLFGATDYFKHERYGKFDWWRDGKTNHDEGYTTELIGREAVKILRNQPKDKPLFLYVPFNAVHYPFEVPEKYKVPYANLKEPRRTYAGMTAAMDEQIGNIIAAIDETGRRKNTLIIFTSDNGGYKPGVVTDNGPLRGGKGSVYEGGVRTCACISWENHIPANASINAMAHVVDWYPTLLKLTGASLKQKNPIDGKDIWPCITENKPSPRNEVLMNTSPNAGALRVGDWKIVLHSGKPDRPQAKKKKKKIAANAEPEVELFNLAEDLGEKKNLANENPQKLKELRKRYEFYARQAATPKNVNEKTPDNLPKN
jgi:arylsulfatase A-like enzyme